MKNLIIKALGVYLDALALVAPSVAAEKGLVLFCRPYRPAIKQKQLAFLHGADKFQFTVEGHQIQGYRWGNGPRKILFLHGWQSHTYRWKTFIEAFNRDDYSLYAFDAPGHGLSSGSFLSVPLYSSVIETFTNQHEDIHGVVAHSIGGFSLLYTLYRKPAIPIDRIVLLAPPGEAGEFIASFKNTLGLSDRTVKLVVDHFARRFQVAPDFFSAQKFAQNLNVKGLIIHDEEDAEAPYHHSLVLREAWQGSRLVSTKGFGHNLKSTSVVKEVVDYVSEGVYHPSAIELTDK